jgi:hypothetical protein
MVKRVQYMSMLCVGFLIAPMAQANKIKKITRVVVRDAAITASQSNNVGSMGAINQDLMNMVAQVMYGKTTGQVIDELVYTYGNGQQNVASLVGIAQLLFAQLGYLDLAIESAQAIVAILPPASPHLVAAKLIINDLSIFITCVQTVLAQVQQNSQSAAPAPAASTPAVAPAPTATTSTAPAPGSGAALASAAVALFGDVASAIAASHAASSSTQTTSSSTSAPATGSGTHHHGHGW